MAGRFLPKKDLEFFERVNRELVGDLKSSNNKKLDANKVLEENLPSKLLKTDKIYFFPKIEPQSSKKLYGCKIIDFSKFTDKSIDFDENNQKILEKLELFLDFRLFLREEPKNEKN